VITPTKAQAAVRDHESRSLLVVAPAGCGKTEALALRIAGLLESDAVPAPKRILAVTFTHRAKDNIRERLGRYVPLGVQRDRVTVSNFHGLAARLIRAHGEIAGIDPQINICETDWVREQCHSMNLGWDDIKAVEHALQVAKQQPSTDEEVAAALADWGNGLASDIEELRIDQSRATYDDMLRYAELILANDAVANLYETHFGPAIVDEYQDLTLQQLRVINRVAESRTTYAGDLAQGIYGFAGASPAKVDEAIRDECGDNLIEFNESHRSSPSVLAMVNSMNPVTGGTDLSCADPDSWPHGGLAGLITFRNVTSEARGITNLCEHILENAPSQRIGVIGRTKARLRFVDPGAEASGHPVHRWEDGVLDPDTARRVRLMLGRIDADEYQAAPDVLAHLRDLAELDKVEDYDSQRALADAISWVLDRFNDGNDVDEVRSRIRVGDQTTLLNAPGIHLLSGHVGKGQQFDWVVIVGFEQDCIPDFRAETPTARDEEARTFSVMLSRARHGVLVTASGVVPTNAGRNRPRRVSEYWNNIAAASPMGAQAINEWLDSADWDQISAR
jgi:DNA helicase-2/ATP-dependent DNA helicase PcrA